MTINPRILLSTASIVAATALGVGATFAFFSDSGQSTNNVFAAGSFDLKLSDDTPETDQDNVTASFGGTNMAPGDCLATQQLRLKNSGTVSGNHVDIAVTNSNPTMAAFLRLSTLNYDAVDQLSQIPAGGNSLKDLSDWAGLPKGVVDLPLTNLNTNHNLDLVVCLDASADNSIQGQTNIATFSATLRQQIHVSE